MRRSRWILACALVASCDGASTPPAHPSVANTTPPAAQPAPIALAILFNGQELWAGNDDVEKDPVAKMPGALHDLERGIDALRLPPGSSVTVVSYSIGAKTVVPWTRGEDMHGNLVGDQHAYYQKLGNDLAPGVATALDALDHSPITRRALIVVGDGSDTDPAKARVALAADARRAAAAHVAVAAIIWKTKGELDYMPVVVDVLAPSPHKVADVGQLPAALAEAVAAVTR